MLTGGEPLRVLIIYNRPVESDEPYAESSQDVLDQVEYVDAALRELGHESARLAIAGDLEPELRALTDAKPDVVFNLVESVNDDPRLYPNAAGMLELLGVPFTGSGSFAMVATTDKALTKLALRGAGLPTPDWVVYDGQAKLSLEPVAPPWLVKPLLEDGSIGIDATSIYDSEFALSADLDSGQPVLIEHYVDGRELNVSILEGPAGLEALPVVEIDFSKFGADRPKVYGYQAKWQPGTFEYDHAKRILHRDESDPLLARLKDLGTEACRLLGVRGYARVDFRVDAGGSPFILEVNTNPCLTDDASFTAAAEAGGYTPAEMIDRILAAALRSA